MTNADWWLRVRQQRDAVQPRQATDVELWRLTKGAHIAAAAVRGVAGVGLELRLLYDGELRRSQVYRLAGDLESEADAKRLELQEGSTEKRTLILAFRLQLPGNGKTGRWRERKASAPAESCASSDRAVSRACERSVQRRTA